MKTFFRTTGEGRPSERYFCPATKVPKNAFSIGYRRISGTSLCDALILLNADGEGFGQQQLRTHLHLTAKCGDNPVQALCLQSYSGRTVCVCSEHFETSPVYARLRISAEGRHSLPMRALHRQHLHRHRLQYLVMLCNVLPLASVSPPNLPTREIPTERISRSWGKFGGQGRFLEKRVPKSACTFGRRKSKEAEMRFLACERTNGADFALTMSLLAKSYSPSGET